MAALKTSKLGRGKQSGAAALYSLPWYVIIGPPGAGKTTALRHSGLVFPYLDPSGGGVRGVGGTRNCDWWFTNEAILLDTAGRYTTEAEDHEEWMAFLEQLRKFRSDKPLNGVHGGGEHQRAPRRHRRADRGDRAQGARPHRRDAADAAHGAAGLRHLHQDRSGRRLRGVLRRPEEERSRRSPGARPSTSTADKTEPGKIFEREFDVLLERLHQRGLKRLAGERNKEVKEKIYQFPLEFAGLKKNLAEFIAIAFQPNAFQGTPIFRGFYFTSGTQEGRPLDRVLGRMSQAMGIRETEQQAQPTIESKSYFLHDVFMNVVFPDADLASRTSAEVRRQQVMRLAITVAALALATISSVPGIRSFLNNREFLAETETRARSVKGVNWEENKPAIDKVKALAPLLDRLKELDKHQGDDGVPFAMGWFMYTGQQIHRPAMTVYVSNLQTGFVLPAKMKLEERLKRANGEQYLQDRNTLKLYLMLSDVDNLDVEWAASRYTGVWAQILRSTTTISEIELKRALRPHVLYYFQLIKARRVVPLQTDAALVEQVRKTLQSVPVRKRYYEMFIESLNDEKYDEEGDDTRENRRFPPLSLTTMFGDRPKVLDSLYSARFEKEKRWQEVDGPFTDKGHYFVIQNVAEGEGLLQREAWVVPLTRDEQAQEVGTNIKRMVDDYEAKYEQQWMDFLRDVRVRNPTSLKEGIKLDNELVQPPWPVLTILRQVENHVMWKNPNPLAGNDALGRVANQQVNQRLSSKAYGLRFNVDVRKIGDRTSQVPDKFAKLVAFGVPPERRPTDGPSRGGVTPLDKYIEKLELIKKRAIEIDDASQGQGDWKQMKDELADAQKFVQTQLASTDARSKEILEQWLMAPLDFQARPTLGAPGQQVGQAPPGQPPRSRGRVVAGRCQATTGRRRRGLQAPGSRLEGRERRGPPRCRTSALFSSPSL